MVWEKRSITDWIDGCSFSSIANKNALNFVKCEFTDFVMLYSEFRTHTYERVKVLMLQELFFFVFF